MSVSSKKISCFPPLKKPAAFDQWKQYSSHNGKAKLYPKTKQYAHDIKSGDLSTECVKLAHNL